MNEAQQNPHFGSSFDDFLSEERILEECEAGALKDVLALQIKAAMGEPGLGDRG